MRKLMIILNLAAALVGWFLYLQTDEKLSMCRNERFKAQGHVDSVYRLEKELMLQAMQPEATCQKM